MAGRASNGRDDPEGESDEFDDEDDGIVSDIADLDAEGDHIGWEPYFGFDEPYENQIDAIETAIETASERGFLAMEGPCGTGKTMAALTAAAYLVRETDQYDNVVVVTPVKQQLQQFVEDLRTLNDSLEEPLSGVSLVGKSDLCPYGREDVFPPDVGVHDRCEDLRENTADLVGDEGDGPTVSEERPDASKPSVAIPGQEDEERWWDPRRGSELARNARPNAESDVTTTSENGGKATVLETAGSRSPYQKRQPSAPYSMVEGDETPLYCPFEADWYARDKGSPLGFDSGKNAVITSDEFLPTAVEYGTCPHRVMGVLLENAEVLIGNYNHLFDSRTRNLTERVLDESTFVIVDEAHRLEERVRDLLSDSIGRQSLRRARGDVRALLRWSRQEERNEQILAARVAQYDIQPGTIGRTLKFYDDVLEWFHERIDSYLTDVHGYGSTFGEPDLPERDLEIPLREPDGEGPDDLREWAIEHGYAGEFWRRLGTVGAAVEDLMGEIDDDRTCVCAPVGALLERWWERDHTTYFREITLQYSPTDRPNVTRPWERFYTPSLLMYNCIPAAQLRRIFSAVGGGVLMSATLEPLEVFRAVSGLDELVEREPDRPIVSRTYDLQFPPENRASWIVDAPPFTQKNRGDPTLENQNEIRETYAYALRSIARSPGNVMLCLPNYREANWAAQRLRDEISKPVLLDESSSNETTTRLREQFVRGGGKVLVTSTRGTLTEGVDYDGEKLQTCAVVGIPLVNVGSPRVRAVRRAYGDRFGAENAFEYALTVPAVRRSRQAIGRVIRGPEERGVRVLVGNRYTPDAHYGSVYEQVPESERREFVRMKPMFLESKLDSFWEKHDGGPRT